MPGQARPHEMSWWLSKETCQELGWVKIAAGWWGCEESKDHREESLFVFKIITSKWFWAWSMRQTGRQGSGRSASDDRGEGRGGQQMGREGDGASDPSPSRTLCKAWKFPLRWWCSVSPPGGEKEGGMWLGNDIHMPPSAEGERETLRRVDKSYGEKCTKTRLMFNEGKYKDHGQFWFALASAS